MDVDESLMWTRLKALLKSDRPPWFQDPCDEATIRVSHGGATDCYCYEQSRMGWIPVAIAAAGTAPGVPARRRSVHTEELDGGWMSWVWISFYVVVAFLVY